MDHDLIPEEPYQIGTLDLTIGHRTARHRPHPVDIENFPHLDPPENLFPVSRLQQTFHGGLDVCDRIVNDRVEPHIDPFLHRQVCCLGLRTHVETNDDGIGSRSQQNITLRDSSHRTMNDPELHFVIV